MKEIKTSWVHCICGEEIEVTGEVGERKDFICKCGNHYCLIPANKITQDDNYPGMLWVNCE